MQAGNYLLYYLIILPVSRLPFPLLYGLSDFLFYSFYYVLRYRKKVVLRNIEMSFPEKSKKEREEIAREFYHHFCDLILESLKAFTISEEEVKKRMVFKNPELVDRYFEKGQSIILAGGHYNNWELFAVGIDTAVKHKAIAIYMPLSSAFFDSKMRETRSKYGLRMIPTRSVKEVFEKEKKNLTLTIFGIDQSPSSADKCYWTTFLNQDTAVPFGAEKYARIYNYPVVYGLIGKEKRGHYSFEFSEICDCPQELSDGEIMERITRRLEKDILKKPAYWLWSHRRWKLTRPALMPKLNLRDEEIESTQPPK